VERIIWSITRSLYCQYKKFVPSVGKQASAGGHAGRDTGLEILFLLILPRAIFVSSSSNEQPGHGRGLGAW